MHINDVDDDDDRDVVSPTVDAVARLVIIDCDMIGAIVAALLVVRFGLIIKTEDNRTEIAHPPHLKTTRTNLLSLIVQ